MATLFCNTLAEAQPVTLYKRSHLASAFMCFLFGVFSVVVTSAQTFKTLLVFQGSNGAVPEVLVQGDDGYLYGVTEALGADLQGTIFKITPNGTLTTLYNFCSLSGCTDGAHGNVLVQGTNGNLFGTTTFGGSDSVVGWGTAFTITPAGSLTTIYTFCQEGLPCTEPQWPNSALIQSNGAFYGTSYVGGINGGGAIFKITNQGNLTTLHSFCGQASCNGGYKPVGGLVLSSDGNFYGTTSAGGVEVSMGRSGNGTMFKITPSGDFTTLYDFCVQGPPCDGPIFPTSGLIEGRDGSFYGVSAEGGFGVNCSDIGCGTIFKITSTGILTVLYNFCSQANCADGAGGVGNLVQATDGNFYGATSYGGTGKACNGGCGTIFKITPSGTLTTLWNFCSEFHCATGVTPSGGLVQDTNGTFYGTTDGLFGGDGTIFSLDVGLPPFVTFVTNSGKVARKLA